MGEKLHKVLANAGCGSRRQIERYIADGRITVDGVVAHIGMRVTEEARISIDGRRVASRTTKPARMLIYNKPLGEISTRSDPKGRPTVFSRLPPVDGRWISVGRLDINTGGLLLFTNDGELAARMMHPSSGLEREYLVRILGNPSPDQLSRLQSGIKLDHRMARFTHVEPLPYKGGRNRWYRVTVNEGRYREVRRLWEAVGCRVNQLKRVRFGPVRLPRDLPPGEFRHVSHRLMEKIRVGLNKAGSRA